MKITITLKGLFLILVLFVISFSNPYTVNAYEDHLIIRILDATSPPKGDFYEAGNWTRFDFDITMEIENPTNHSIPCTYGCSPTPYPHVSYELEDDSLEIALSFMNEWAAGTWNIEPGVYERTDPFVMLIMNCPKERDVLPLGNYTIWFDFTNCSSVPVPVIKYKLLISVNSTDIVYLFEHTNRTVVYDVDTSTASPTNTTIDYDWWSFLASSIFIISYLLVKGKRERELVKMKLNQKRNWLFFVVIVLIGLNFVLIPRQVVAQSYSRSNSDVVSSIAHNTQFKLDLSSHSTIRVISDENFTDYGFSGNGTETEPYRIENLEIITDDSIGILIYNTTKHFIIRNCFISALYVGIGINEISKDTAVIENNTCANHIYYGIHLANSNGIIVKNNLCYGNHYGILINNALHLEIISNFCHSNTVGIYISYTAHTIMQYNLLTYNFDGMFLSAYERSVVTENIFRRNSYAGIRMDYSKHSLITGNLCTDGVFGMIIERSQNISISQNECTNSNIDGIFSRKTDDSIITENKCSQHNNSGIRIDHCSNISVTSNICWENKDSGIWTYYGHFPGLLPPIIESNLFKNNTMGMRIWKTYHAIIVNNTCESNIHGILLIESRNSEIMGNVLLRNERYGIRINTGLSYANVIYSNYFICNNLNGTEDGNSQAYDESTNHWYDEEANIGNYYSDYSGEGEYMIDGKTERTDPYPTTHSCDCFGTDKISSQSSLITLIVLLTFLGVTTVFTKSLVRS